MENGVQSHEFPPQLNARDTPAMARNAQRKRPQWRWCISPPYVRPYYADGAPRLLCTVVQMSAWQPIETAPTDRHGSSVLLLCGETILGIPFITVGSFVSGYEAEEFGYRSYAKYGAWMIWRQGGEDFYCIDLYEPTHWQPIELPEAP
jgi:hypothetical protein